MQHAFYEQRTIAMAIYKKTMGNDFKSLRIDRLQGIQLLEVRDGEYTSLWIK